MMKTKLKVRNNMENEIDMWKLTCVT